MARRKPQKRERIALIVLGMHRSGTSALTGVLGHMGADWPRDLMPATEMNAKGFFESNRITSLNDQLLASAGFTWFAVPRFPDDWFVSPKADEFAELAAEELQEEFGRSHLFAMKDPRACRLLPFWHRALEAAGCWPVHVCTHRNPLEVAASLRTRYNFDLDYGLLLWLRHVLDAEAGCRGMARSFTSYTRVMEDWKREIQKIGATLDLKWPRTVEMAAENVNGFLSRELQNFHAASAAQNQREEELPEWVSVTYEILERWAAGGEDPADHATLDGVRKHLDQAQGFLGSVIRRVQQQRVEGQKVQAQLEEVTQGAEAQKVAQAEAQKAAMALEARTLSLTGERDALRDTCLRMETELATVQELSETREHDLHRLQSTLAQREHELAELRETTQRDGAELAAMGAELEETRAEQARLQAALGRASRHMDELTRRASAAMRQELQTRLDEPARLARLKREAEQREAQIRQLTEERDEARSDTQRFADDLHAVDRDSQEKLMAERDAQRARATALEQELAAVRRQLAAQESAVHALRGSTSWRITGPMRRLKELLGGRQS